MPKTIRHILSWCGRAATRPMRAFTLIELMVALGALAFVAVGIAAIFEATGRTLTAGKRVSAFTTYANLIQQQMRADFESMSRDGFLVIRNEYAGSLPDDSNSIDRPDNVPLFDGDLNARPRRVDQVMFFAKGAFESAREPLNPDIIARADAARIYYGHGQRAIRRPQAGATPDRFDLPLLNDNNAAALDRRAARLGAPQAGGDANPNRFASDWILLRHVTLLRPPEPANPRFPAPPARLFDTIPYWNGNQPNPIVADSDVQVALQPAASSLFRRLNRIFPQPAEQVRSIREARDSRAGSEPGALSWRSPVLASGIVDIATTDLAEIRQIVNTADTWPLSPSNPGGADVADARFFTPADNDGPDGSNQGPDGQFRLLRDPASPRPGEDEEVIARMQAWMDDAWPADVMPEDPRNRDRIRAELAPSNFIGVAETTGPGAIPTDLERAFRRADQVMLASSNFLPRCTEFIVEWSFGRTFPPRGNPPDPNFVEGMEGQLIWHGMDRRLPGNSTTATTGQILSPNNSTQVGGAVPYLDGTSSPTAKLVRLGRQLVQWRRIDGTLAFRDPSGNNPIDDEAHLVRSELVHGLTANQLEQRSRFQPLTSYFGFVDPTFDADRDPILPNGQGDGALSFSGDAQSPTLPWAWPKLIRVTLSLADPNDPTVEQTFQFVFDVPPPR